MSDQAPPPPPPFDPERAAPPPPPTAAPPTAAPAPPPPVAAAAGLPVETPVPAGPAAPSMLSSTCPSCGAQTRFAPGTTSLRCPSCGAERTIEAAPAAQITEHSLDDWVSKNPTTLVADIAAQTLQCQGCGATTETTDLSGSCQFCGGALVAVAPVAGLVPPEAVVPFTVDQAGARDAFKGWIGSRWFAPNALKKVGATEGLSGTYLPHWTYDAHTETDYRGQRGDYYYTTETRTVSDGKGGTRTETYQQRHTRWRRTEGHVNRDFDDVLVVASHRLDAERLAKMGPWQLGDAKPFQPEYLTGYSTVRYDVDPTTGSEQARGEMRGVIDGDCRRDIGGDEQRVDQMDVTYSQAMFKLMLMPLWIATYLYAGKSWQVLVNANTGEVIGDRPYSAWKITAAVVAALVVVAIVVAVVALSKGS